MPSRSRSNASARRQRPLRCDSGASPRVRMASSGARRTWSSSADRQAYSSRARRASGQCTPSLATSSRVFSSQSSIFVDVGG